MLKPNIPGGLGELVEAYDTSNPLRTEEKEISAALRKFGEDYVTSILGLTLRNKRTGKGVYDLLERRGVSNPIRIIDTLRGDGVTLDGTRYVLDFNKGKFTDSYSFRETSV